MIPPSLSPIRLCIFRRWFDPIEACVRERVREFIGAMIEGELDATLLRPRYERLPKNAAGAPAAVGHRHGHRARSLIGTFGRTEIEVPRAAAERSRRWRQPGRSRRPPVTFTRLPPSQWRSARTTNAIERLHKEFKRRIKTQTVLPSAETAAMLFWALLASGQISMRKVDGWRTLARTSIGQPIDLAA